MTDYLSEQCDCHPTEFPFYCDRHKCRKTEHLWRLCGTRADYRQLWDRQAAPNTLIRCVVKPNWQDLERRSRAALPDWDTVELVKPDGKILSNAIRQHGARLVISNAFAVRVPALMDLARKYPTVVFMGVDHSSLNHTLNYHQHFLDERQILEGTRELANLWYASPDRHAPWTKLGYQRYRWWPNPIYLPPYVPPPKLDRACVCIASRLDWMKGLPSQIAAAALIQRSTGCRVVVNLRDRDQPRYRSLLQHAHACQLEFEEPGWMDFDQWLRFLREEVSVLLQPSMSDSFNYATVDALSVGRPFVGSETIPHTPKDWRVRDPNDPAEIALITTRILGTRPIADRCRLFAEQLAERQNVAHAKLIAEITSQAHHPKPPVPLGQWIEEFLVRHAPKYEAKLARSKLVKSREPRYRTLEDALALLAVCIQCTWFQEAEGICKKVKGCGAKDAYRRLLVSTTGNCPENRWGPRTSSLPED
jgi:hypothetical protein